VNRDTSQDEEKLLRLRIYQASPKVQAVKRIWLVVGCIYIQQFQQFNSLNMEIRIEQVENQQCSLLKNTDKSFTDL
jgi:hypothetical protein